MTDHAARSDRSSTEIVSTRKGRRRPTRDEGPAVTVEAIVDAAYGLAVTEGLDAIQIRRVAGMLGVWPQAIYHYVPSKHELLKLVADRALSTREPASLPAGAPWSDRMLDHVRRVTDVYDKHPGLAELVITTPDLAWTAEATTIAEEALSMLFELGLDAAEAQRASRALSAIILGEAQLNGNFPSWKRAASVAIVDREQFPALQQTLEADDTCLAGLSGIEIFVAGIERLCQQRRRADG